MGRKQHYSNHRYYNPVYYYLLVPAGAGFVILSVAYFVTEGFMQEQWVKAVYHLLAGIIVIAGIVLLQKHAVTHQKRMILQEMRLRYFILTGKPFNAVEHKLSSRQIIALRFASDSELLSLLETTLEEELSASQIKKKIKHWKGDYLQV
jgi:thiol:disulfide interchange protein